jgi:hypothetical protein
VRNEESCETERGLVAVPVIVEPVPVQVHLAVVLDEIRHVEVAIAIPNERAVRHPYHLPLEYSQGCISFGIYNAPAHCTKYLRF